MFWFVWGLADLTHTLTKTESCRGANFGVTSGRRSWYYGELK